VLPKISIVQVADSVLQRFIGSVVERINLISDVPFLDGIYHRNISLVTGTNQINHRLGRLYLGYIILRKTASADIYESGTVDKSKVISVYSTGNVTIDLWVF